MNRIGEWCLTAVVGAGFGAVLGLVSLKLHQIVLLGSGAGNASLGLLFRGPLELLRAGSGNLPMLVFDGIILYCLGAILLVEARRQGWRRDLAMMVYLCWSVATLAGLVTLSLQVGAGLFFYEERSGWHRIAAKEPFCLAAFGLLLIAWHATVWAILLRGGSFDAAINVRTRANSVRRLAKNVPGR